MESLPSRLAAGALAATLIPVIVAPALAAERREAGRHEHGTSELRVAIDGGDVEVELEGPAANFIGFEHQPSTAAEQQALDAALATLREPGQLLGWPAAAGCQLVSADVTPPDYGEAGDEGHHDDGDEDDHGDDHDADEHDAHAGDGGHSEFAALYVYRCSSPGALDALRVLVLERFPGTSRLNASVAGPGGQAGATLTPAAVVLKLRP
jgi:hypothetical protein